MTRLRTYKMGSPVGEIDLSRNRRSKLIDAYRPRVTSWILRILSGAGEMPPVTLPAGNTLKSVATFLNLPQLVDPKASPAEVRAALDEATMNAAASDCWEQPTAPVSACKMRESVEWICQSAGLTMVEQEIFEFAVLLRVLAPLRAAVRQWDSHSLHDMPAILSDILNLSLEEVEEACLPQGSLFDTGLLYTSEHSEKNLISMLSVSGHLAQRIAFHRESPDTILSHLAVPLKATKLGLPDFAHVQKHTELAQCWLAGSLKAASTKETLTRSAGHLLVTGGPGLGKTEWGRALLANAQAKAMELEVLDNDGTALSGEERLSHLRLAMRLLRGTSNGVILFDEADDIFSSANPRGSSSAYNAVTMVNHRASLNRMLETNQIPVIWIMNRPEVLDPAVLRRFDVVVHFDSIPRSIRLAMLQSRLGIRNDIADGRSPFIAEEELQRWATVETLSPAMIDRLAQVRERSLAAGVEMDLSLSRHWLRQRLPGKATQHLRETRQNHPLLQPRWQADTVNASENLLAVVQGIQRCGSGRVLLYGPPGTGKTAFAKALAVRLDKPLLERRASDLLSPYVGETEQRISEAFSDAVGDGAVLFIDEADSLVYSRDSAVRTWEVSQVNELLEQLSDFDGIAVLATNRLQALDSALLRRMDVKVEFSALSTEQVERCLMEMLRQLGDTSEVNPKERNTLRTLTDVTPGDFACVARRLVILGNAHGAAPSGGRWAPRLIAMLQEEVSYKPSNKTPMGFVHLGNTSTVAELEA